MTASYPPAVWTCPECERPFAHFVLRAPADVDESLAALLREAWETFG